MGMGVREDITGALDYQKVYFIFLAVEFYSVQIHLSRSLVSCVSCKCVYLVYTLR